jgi:hypothetical protein
VFWRTISLAPAIFRGGVEPAAAPDYSNSGQVFLCGWRMNGGRPGGARVRYDKPTLSRLNPNLEDTGGLPGPSIGISQSTLNGAANRVPRLSARTVIGAAALKAGLWTTV